MTGCRVREHLPEILGLLPILTPFATVVVLHLAGAI